MEIFEPDSQANASRFDKARILYKDLDNYILLKRDNWENYTKKLEGLIRDCEEDRRVAEELTKKRDAK